MLMGFLGYQGGPPPPPAADEPPGEPGGDSDDTGIPLSPSMQAARSRFRSQKSSRVGRYAWAISLSIHAAVLIGAYIAFRYYFRPAARPAQAVESGGTGSGALVAGGDATDGVHSLWSGLTLDGGSERGPGRAADSENQLPDFSWLARQTVESLRDEPGLAPAPLRDVPFSPGAPAHRPTRRPGGASQSGPDAVR